jgi:hypothetical protein
METLNACPFSNLYFSFLSKNANSPPSKSSFKINEQDTARGAAFNESVCLYKKHPSGYFNSSYPLSSSILQLGNLLLYSCMHLAAPSNIALSKFYVLSHCFFV